MKIIDIINFYYSKYSIIQVCIELSDGIEGQYHTCTKEEALSFIKGYENEKVVNTNFQTHYIFCGNAEKKLDIPMLYILYK